MNESKERELNKGLKNSLIQKWDLQHLHLSDLNSFLQGSFEISINATSLFDNPYPPEDEDFYDDLIFIPEIKEMVISQSVQVILLTSTSSTSSTSRRHLSPYQQLLNYLEIFNLTTVMEMVNVHFSSNRSFHRSLGERWCRLKTSSSLFWLSLGWSWNFRFTINESCIQRISFFQSRDVSFIIWSSHLDLFVFFKIRSCTSSFSLHLWYNLNTWNHQPQSYSRTSYQRELIYITRPDHDPQHEDQLGVKCCLQPQWLPNRLQASGTTSPSSTYLQLLSLQLGIPHSLVVTSFSYKLPEDASLLLNIKYIQQRSL